MSKRFINQQQGDRKKAKLDVTAADHNFPLSQNFVGSNKVSSEANTWGDDNDDEILLLASQACEEVYGDQNQSLLADYSIALQPASTSTQICPSMPTTSKASFSFKQPYRPSLSTKANDCNKISSPLPGISTKIKTDGVNISDDLILNDKICVNQDSNYVYRQLLQLQEENAKLKSENGKLMEKCVTKEGEASILRSQLKNCQTTVDSVKMEKIKAQEKTQMEWSDKLTAANNQMQELRTQLDFKNLEIISVKEKCKRLESSKVKLTQVTLAGNDVSASQRLNQSSCLPYETNKKYNKVKTVSNGIQTDCKSHFVKLNKVLRLDSSNLNEILPLIVQPCEETLSIIDFNEKLRRPLDMSQNKCRMLYTFQLPSTPQTKKRCEKLTISLPCVYECVANIVAGKEYTIENYLRIINIVNEALTDVQSELETISQRMTSAFHKEMDKRYIESTNKLDVVTRLDLLSGRYMFKDEQAILARRLMTILVYIIDDSKRSDIFKQLTEGDKSPMKDIVHRLDRICILLDATSCALFYSGLLSSFLYLLDVLPNETVTIIKSIVQSRPMLFVSCQILSALTRVTNVSELCAKGGNLKVDYDQGVLLYKNDSCTLQVALKQTEAALKCSERQRAAAATCALAGDLLLLFNDTSPGGEDSIECECQLVLLKVLVHALQICSNYLLPESSADTETRRAAQRVCVGGANALCGCAGRLAHLRYHRGLLLRLADAPLLGDILSETLSTFQAPEEAPSSYNSQAWAKSFQTFSITD